MALIELIEIAAKNTLTSVFYSGNKNATLDEIIFNGWKDDGTQILTDSTADSEIDNTGVFQLDFTTPNEDTYVCVKAGEQLSSGNFKKLAATVIKVGSPSQKLFYHDKKFQTGLTVPYEIFDEVGTILDSGTLTEKDGGFYFVDVSTLVTNFNCLFFEVDGKFTSKFALEGAEVVAFTHIATGELVLSGTAEACFTETFSIIIPEKQPDKSTAVIDRLKAALVRVQLLQQISTSEGSSGAIAVKETSEDIQTGILADLQNAISIANQLSEIITTTGTSGLLSEKQIVNSKADAILAARTKAIAQLALLETLPTSEGLAGSVIIKIIMEPSGGILTSRTNALSSVVKLEQIDTSIGNSGTIVTKENIVGINEDIAKTRTDALGLVSQLEEITTSIGQSGSLTEKAFASGVSDISNELQKALDNLDKLESISVESRCI